MAFGFPDTDDDPWDLNLDFGQIFEDLMDNFFMFFEEVWKLIETLFDNMGSILD